MFTKKELNPPTNREVSLVNIWDWCNIFDLRVSRIDWGRKLIVAYQTQNSGVIKSCLIISFDKLREMYSTLLSKGYVKEKGKSILPKDIVNLIYEISMQQDKGGV